MSIATAQLEVDLRTLETRSDSPDANKVVPENRLEKLRQVAARLPEKDDKYQQYFRINPESPTFSRFQLIPCPEIAMESLLGTDSRLFYIQQGLRDYYEHSHLSSNKGVPFTLAEPGASVNPLEKNDQIFSGLSNGAVVFGGANSAQVFGRSVWRLPVGNEGSKVGGWLQYKGTCPHSRYSEPIHMMVPREAEEGELLKQYAQSSKVLQVDNRYAVSDTFGIVHWEIYGAVTQSDARHEAHNSFRFMELYLRLFKEVPDIQTPLAVRLVNRYPMQNYLIPAHNILASRATEYPDEGDMLKIWLVEKKKKQLPAASTPDQVKNFIDLELERLSGLDHEQVAQEYLDIDPLVVIEYYSPTYFRNSGVDLLRHPNKHLAVMETLRDQVGLESIEQVQMEVYRGAILDLLRNYYQLDDTFALPTAGSFDELKTLINNTYREQFDNILEKEMKIMGRTIGILNGVGMIPLTALETKDWSWGRINDFDWGRGLGSSPLTFPDTDTPPLSLDSVTPEAMYQQWELISFQINNINWMIGGDRHKMVKDFIAARIEALDIINEATQAELGISKDYYDSLQLITEKIRGVEISS